MAHPAPDASDAEHPLHFLQRAPVVTVLGDPQQLALAQQLTLLIRLASSRPLLAAFLDSALAALNAQVAQMLAANGEEPSHAACLTLTALAAPDTLTALTNDPLYAPALELLVVLATVLAASTGLNPNTVIASAEPHLFARLAKYGMQAMLDLTTYGLAECVLTASKTLADVAHFGSQAVALAWSLATTTDTQAAVMGAEYLNGRLIVPTAASHLIHPTGAKEIIPLGSGNFTMVAGPRHALSTLDLNLLTNGYASSPADGLGYLPPEPALDVVEQQLLPLVDRLDLSFLPGSSAKRVFVLRDLISGRTDPAHIDFVGSVAHAAASDRSREVQVLAVGANATLLESVQMELAYHAAQARVEILSPIDVLGDTAKGNFKPIDRHWAVNLSAVRGTAAESIAVVGLSCRMPGAETVDGFWQNLLDGKDMVQRIPERLFDIDDYRTPSYRDKNTMRASQGNFIDHPWAFDPAVFGLDETMAQKLDPQQRLALSVALEALESAGYAPRKGTSNDPEHFGSIFGICSDDYQQNRSYTISAPFGPALLRANIPGRINRFFGWSGPALTCDTACSGALVAIESACNFLLQGKADAVLTGGINVLTQPQIFIGLDRGFFLSPTGQCKTLDDKGDGYSRADALAFVVLKRLSDAVNDGDNVLGVINSAVTNHSGETYSITHPHNPTQRRLYRSAMLASKIDTPNEICYNEMHGTGTAAGDFEEVTGLVETYASIRSADRPLVIGSVKANIGHSESTAGASALLKTLLVSKHQLVPRHIGIKSKLNTTLPAMDGLKIPLDHTPVRSHDQTRDDRVFAVANFSAAAGNSALIVRPGPGVEERPHLTDRVPALLIISGASLYSVNENCKRLLTWLDSHPHTDVAHLCAALATRRHHAYRVVGLVNTVYDVRTLLEKQEPIEAPRPPAEGHGIAYAFTGQGSQYLHMGHELYARSPPFRASMDKCNDVAQALGFGDFISTIYPAGDAEVDPSPVHAQLGLVAIEISLAGLLKLWNVPMQAVMGHSLGEYAALHVAGVLSLTDVLMLVGKRAELMIEHCEANASSMLAIKAPEGAVRRLMQQAAASDCEIACYNSTDDLVLAGPLPECQRVKVLADQAEPKIKNMLLTVPYAFHSRAVQPLVPYYAPIAAEATFRAPIKMVAANCGRVVERGGVFNADYLVKHLRDPVRFADAISALTLTLERNQQPPIRCFVELGPHSTVVPMLRSIFASEAKPPTMIPTLKRGAGAWNMLQETLLKLVQANIQLDWAAIHDSLGYSRGLTAAIAAELPSYAFDYADYVVPYKDRGLREANVEKQKCMARTSRSRASSVGGSRVSLPPPKHSLLGSCTKLQLAAPCAASFEAPLNKTPMRDMILGHQIVGVPIAPAHLFGELAMEAAEYLCSKLSDEAGALFSTDAFEVLNLSMFSSVFIQTEWPQQAILVEAMGSPLDSDGCTVQFYTREGEATHQHGACTVRLINIATVEREWMRLRHLVTKSIATMPEHASTVLRQSMIYRRFETICKYAENYQGMERMWISDEHEEAVAQIRWPLKATSGKFIASPNILDSLGGLTGFICNVMIADADTVYIADGIGRTMVTPLLTAFGPHSGTLKTWARVELQGTVAQGDVYWVNEHNQLVGCMQDANFKRIGRSALQRLLNQSYEQMKARTKHFIPTVPATPVPARSMARSVRSPSMVDPLDAASNGTYRRESQPATTSVTPAFGPRADLTADGVLKGSKLWLQIAGPAYKPDVSSPGPLILLPDGGGTGGCFQRAVQGYNWTRPVIAINSPFLGHEERWPASGGLTALADEYTKIIEQIQPDGLFNLGGYSLGAMCAVEVARQLVHKGKNVERLILLDSPAMRNNKKMPPLPPGSLDKLLAKVEYEPSRQHFIKATQAVPTHTFLLEWAEPASVLIVNAMDDTLTPRLMTSKVADWKEVFRSADLQVKVVDGDHQTFLPNALHAVAQVVH